MPLSNTLRSLLSFSLSNTLSICSFSNLGLQYGISYSLFEVSNSNHASLVQSLSSMWVNINFRRSFNPAPSSVMHKFEVQKSISGMLNRDCASICCAWARCAARRMSICFWVSAICCFRLSRVATWASRWALREAIAVFISFVSASSFATVC